MGLPIWVFTPHRKRVQKTQTNTSKSTKGTDVRKQKTVSENRNRARPKFLRLATRGCSLNVVCVLDLDNNNVANSYCLVFFLFLSLFVLCCCVDLIRPSCMLSGDRILCELVFSGVKCEMPCILWPKL